MASWREPVEVGRGDVNPYGIPVPNPHEQEGPDEGEFPNGFYSAPRTCELCGTFTTSSRDEFWDHVGREHGPPPLEAA